MRGKSTGIKPNLGVLSRNNTLLPVTFHKEIRRKINQQYFHSFL